MKRLMSVGFLFATMMMVGCLDPATVTVTNVSSADSENGVIRVWIVDASVTPPTTKAEAAAVGWPNLNAVTFPGIGVATGNMDVTDYYIVAADEAAFQSLEDDDPIADAVAIQGEVSTADGSVFYEVSNEDGGIPEINEGTDPFGDDGDDGEGDES